MQGSGKFNGRWRGAGLALTGLVAALGATLSADSAAAAERLAFTDTRASVGTMQVGETKTVQLTLTNRSADALEIESVTSSCPCTTAQLDHTTLQPGQTAQLTAEVLHDLYVTPDVRSQITVKANGGTAEASVLLEGHLDAPVIAEPAVVQLDAHAPVDAAQMLTLRSRDGRALGITRFDAPDWLSVTRHDDGGFEAYRVRLSGAVPYELLQGEITFWTDDARQSVLRVPVVATAPDRMVEVSPRIVRLNQVTPGQAGNPVLIRVAGASTPEIVESLPAVNFRVEPGQRIGEYVITPVVEATAATGPVRGTVRAVWKQGTREDHVDIGVIGTVAVAQAD